MTRREMIFLTLGLLVGVLLGLALAGNPPAPPPERACSKPKPEAEEAPLEFVGPLKDVG